MKVHELIKTLSQLPQDVEVILSSDPEGNSYDTAYDVAVAYYDPTDWGYLPIDQDDLDDVGDGDENEDLVIGVYIWP